MTPAPKHAISHNGAAAIALCLDLRGGRRIWCPPVGRPFWAHCTPTQALSEAEIEKVGLRLVGSSSVWRWDSTASAWAPTAAPVYRR